MRNVCWERSLEQTQGTPLSPTNYGVVSTPGRLLLNSPALSMKLWHLPGASPAILVLSQKSPGLMPPGRPAGVGPASGGPFTHFCPGTCRSPLAYLAHGRHQSLPVIVLLLHAHLSPGTDHSP